MFHATKTMQRIWIAMKQRIRRVKLSAFNGAAIISGLSALGP
jgi:hypothetical protein